MGKYVTVFEMRTDEPFRTFADGCCGAIRTNESGGDKYVLLKDNIDTESLIKKMSNSVADSLYDVTGISPTLVAGMSHGKAIPLILESL